MRRVLMLGLTLALLACSPSGRPVNPHWSQLTEQEQSVLAPLQPEWNRYNPRKKQEFLALVGHWASLTPAEQTNVQLHLYDWALMEMPDRVPAAAGTGRRAGGAVRTRAGARGPRARGRDRDAGRTVDALSR